MYVDPNGLAKRKLINGIKVLVDDNTAEFILENGRRIKIRNSRFIDCNVSLSDLEDLTKVSQKTIDNLKKNFGDDLSIKYDNYGQPDFSNFLKARVRIPNPRVNNSGKKAWEALKKQNRPLYNTLSPNQDKYVWHHAFDGSLELVDKELHTAYQHTGLKSVLGAACMSVIPGLAALSEGRISDAGREVAVEVSPLGWGQWISSYFEWIYDWAWDDIYGEGADKVEF